MTAVYVAEENSFCHTLILDLCPVALMGLSSVWFFCSLLFSVSSCLFCGGWVQRDSFLFWSFKINVFISFQSAKDAVYTLPRNWMLLVLLLRIIYSTFFFVVWASRNFCGEKWLTLELSFWSSLTFWETFDFDFVFPDSVDAAVIIV